MEAIPALLSRYFTKGIAGYYKVSTLLEVGIVTLITGMAPPPKKRTGLNTQRAINQKGPRNAYTRWIRVSGNIYVEAFSQSLFHTTAVALNMGTRVKVRTLQ